MGPAGRDYRRAVFTVLIALCLITGWSWEYMTGFGVILVVTMAIGARALRHSAETSTG